MWLGVLRLHSTLTGDSFHNGDADIYSENLIMSAFFFFYIYFIF